VIHTIYIEEEIKHHPLTRRVCQRYPNAVRIPCERYGEIFNRKAQNFRLQKQRPALILAKKHRGFVLPTPADYGIGGTHNYYFSHLMNCIYDCRYCFLQGMYRSANYVLFVNYEDFEAQIRLKVEQADGQESYFFSGYDCDSLALEPITGFVQQFLPLFSQLPLAWLELRTKSTQIRPLLDHTPLSNCVIAFSLSPKGIAQDLELKAPTLEKRIEAMQLLQSAGWKIGLRFDPVLFTPNYQALYEDLFAQVFSVIHEPSIHSVSLGAFRLPETFFRRITRLYPDEALFAGPLECVEDRVSFRKELEQEVLLYCQSAILKYVPTEKYFPCQPPCQSME
jgi:spore photoproduct lyase